MTKPLLYLTEKYEILEQVGEGTYGKVYKGKCKTSGKLVALKKFRIETEKEGFSLTAVREIKTLQQVQHRNIIEMIEIIMAQPPDKDVYIVSDYLEHDLSGLLKTQDTFSDIFDKGLIVKGIVFQLLNGLMYLHEEAKILHRDIKGSNILIDRWGVVKLADFGLARSVGSEYDGHLSSSNGILLTNRVITMWYRPPELLLGADSYGPEVDMWGIGCIFAELFMRKSAFAGSDEVSQIEAILNGLSMEQNDPSRPLAVLSKEPWYNLIPPSLTVNFTPPSEEHSVRWLLEKSPLFDGAASKLIFQMLEFNPQARISCRQALQSIYFAECSSRNFWSEYRSIFQSSPIFNLEIKSGDGKSNK